MRESETYFDVKEQSLGTYSGGRNVPEMGGKKWPGVDRVCVCGCVCVCVCVGEGAVGGVKLVRKGRGGRWVQNGARWTLG